jgi:hypothetical protein
MENILIVESENDKFFVDAFIQHLNIKNVEVSTAFVCCVDTYECLKGLDKDKLTAALKSLVGKANRGYISKIGVLIDQDDKTDQERLELIDNCISAAYSLNNPTISAKNQLFKIAVSPQTTVEMGAYFTNVSGKGELETVLKAIKKDPSPHADCLDAWRNCLNTKGITLRDKIFDKVWTNFYMRYDTCDPQTERNQAETKCNNKTSMKKPIWNFDHPCLEGLKDFLLLFSK